MFNIFNQLVIEENMQCVRLIQKDRKYDGPSVLLGHLNKPVAITMWEAAKPSGHSLRQVEKVCPFHVMQFDTAYNATGFLHSHQDNIRFFNDVLFYTRVKV